MARLRSARRRKLPSTRFALPKQRKLPLTDASHVRNAAARLNQVKGVSSSAKAGARRRLAAAYRRFGITPGSRSPVRKARR